MHIGTLPQREGVGAYLGINSNGRIINDMKKNQSCKGLKVAVGPCLRRPEVESPRHAELFYRRKPSSSKRLLDATPRELKRNYVAFTRKPHVTHYRLAPDTNSRDQPFDKPRHEPSKFEAKKENELPRKDYQVKKDFEKKDLQVKKVAKPLRHPLQQTSLGMNSPKNVQITFTQKAKESTGKQLEEYVTTFKCEAKTLLACTSQANIAKHVQPRRCPRYYISPLLNAFYSSKPSSFDQLCLTHLSSSVEILSYVMKSKMQPPSHVEVMPLPKTTRQTIVFDLDETLIHCNENLGLPHDVALPIKFPNGMVIKAGINIRPYAKECLRELARHFELIVFTASHECYANVIVDYLDPTKQLIAHRFFRDSCFKTEEGFYVKDLRVVDRDLRKLLLVDNAAYSYCFQLDNGVPIVPFYENKADLQLKSLIAYVKDFGGVKDVRAKNKDYFKLVQYCKGRKVEQLVEQLYGDCNQ